MTDPQEAEQALASALRAHGYTVRVAGDWLEVGVPGQVRDLAVRCLPRPEDGGRLWFFGGSGEPLAPADRLMDALAAIKGRLASTSPPPRGV